MPNRIKEKPQRQRQPSPPHHHPTIAEVLPSPSVISSKLSDFISGAYHAVAITSVCLGLVVWSVRQEGRIHELEREYEAFTNRVERIDQFGTRALAERIGIIVNRHENLDARELAHNTEMLARVSDLSARSNVTDRDQSERINAIIKQIVDLEFHLRKLDVFDVRQLDATRRVENLERILLNPTQTGKSR